MQSKNVFRAGQFVTPEIPFVKMLFRAGTLSATLQSEGSRSACDFHSGGRRPV
jgi:hypothetical protein